MNKKIKPLYRKVNTKAFNHSHNVGNDSKNDRNTKKGISKSMKRKVHRGLDYTPLYKFLISKVGKNWDDVYSEAVSRLDKKEPIFHIVAKHEHEMKDYVRCGESSYYSCLYIDKDNILQKVNPNLKNEDLTPTCSCCTHTFNGNVLNNKYEQK